MKSEWNESPVRIPVSGAELAGSLLCRASNAQLPGMLLISGSGSNDRDESVCGQQPFRVIAQHFAHEGWAVLRCDDRGAGESTGDAALQSFDDSVADVRCMFEELTRHESVDAHRIVLLGHSEGGLVAARASQFINPLAIITLATPVEPIEPLLHRQAWTLSVENGATSHQLAHERKMNEAAFAIARSSVDSAIIMHQLISLFEQSLGSWPDVGALDQLTIKENAHAMAAIVGAPDYRSLLCQDPARLISAVQSPLLAIYGGRDSQVPHEPNARLCRSLIEGKPFSKVSIFAEHNHLLQVAASGLISEYAELGQSPDSAVLKAMSKWLAELMSAEHSS